MNLLRRITTALAALAALLALGGMVTACTIAEPQVGSEIALQYGGGPLDSKAFVECETGRDVSDQWDTHYYMPEGQRDFTFSADRDADSAPLSATTRDNQQIQVTGTVKFTLDTTCQPFDDPVTHKHWPGGRAQEFFELIAKKYNALSDEGGSDSPEGWDSMLRNYVGAAVTAAANNEAGKYDWQKLYSDPAVKAQWARDVQNQLPGVLRPLTFGQDIFHIDTVLLQRPAVSQQLADGLAAKQAAVLRAQAVDVDKQAAANFPGGVPGYQAYQQQQAVNEAIKSGKVQVIPIPAGSPVIVSPGTK